MLLTKGSMMRCHFCKVVNNHNYVANIRPIISSDCQVINSSLSIFECQNCGLIQKNIDDSWRKLCNKIYENYKIYYQASGAEQKTRDVQTGIFENRTGLIVKYIDSILHFKNSGNILDVGCGNGALLKSFNTVYPNWSVVGTDLNDQFSSEVTNISPSAVFINNDNLFNSQIKFDVVTLVHCLEHIVSPYEYLIQLAELLKGDGTIIIQVPDIENNPFDLTIADHASHFSKSTLLNILEKSKMEVIEVGNPISPNEITLVARKNESKRNSNYPKPTFLLKKNKDFLDHAIKIVSSATKKNNISVFGSSIAATWISSQFIDRIDAFIDEDLNRVGKNHLGKPIISPSETKIGSVVYLALSSRLYNLVKKKFLSREWIILDH